MQFLIGQPQRNTQFVVRAAKYYLLPTDIKRIWNTALNI